jgi:CRP/FNR family cyclic AMP-dependent transcriptional regulator
VPQRNPPSDDTEARADAIGRAPPFSTWPRDALLRLAAAASVTSHRTATTLIANGRRCDTIILPVEGLLTSCVSTPGGRRVVFKFDDSAYAYGLAPLLDDLPLQHDLTTDGPVTVMRVPHVAVRAELARLPSLWETIAAELNRRGRRMTKQMQQFVFDAPLVRAASLLLGLIAQDGKPVEDGPVAIPMRLPQERLAELLGTSRQWATALVRELCAAGLVDWRYGRVTVLDPAALRRLADRSIDSLGQPGAAVTGQPHGERVRRPGTHAYRHDN